MNRNSISTENQYLTSQTNRPNPKRFHQQLPNKKTFLCVFQSERKKNELKCEGTMHDLLQYRNEKLFQCERKQNFADSNSIVIKVKHSFISPNKFYQLLFVASIVFLLHCCWNQRRCSSRHELTNICLSVINHLMNYRLTFISALSNLLSFK